MLNLIPVVMFLLLQGAGGSELSMRQQQALLDLAQRVQLTQVQAEPSSKQLAGARVSAQCLALWIRLIEASEHQSSPVSVEKPGVPRLEGISCLAHSGFGRQSQPRDGPLAA